MTRTMVITALFFSIFSCSDGCAKKTPSQSKKFENKNNEWIKLPDDLSNPGGMVLQNTRTKASIVISFIGNKEMVPDAIKEEISNIADSEVEMSKVILSENNETSTFNFKYVMDGQPFTGTVTIKRSNQGKLFLMILGIWPNEFHKEMSSDHKAMVDSITDELKSLK